MESPEGETCRRFFDTREGQDVSPVLHLPLRNFLREIKGDRLARRLTNNVRIP